MQGARCKMQDAGCRMRSSPSEKLSVVVGPAEAVGRCEAAFHNSAGLAGDAQFGMALVQGAPRGLWFNDRVFWADDLRARLPGCGPRTVCGTEGSCAAGDCCRAKPLHPRHVAPVVG